MDEDNSNSLDIAGVRPVSVAVKKATEATIAGTSALLSRICLPAAEEFGLMLRDRVEHWRLIQMAKLSVKTEQKLQALKVPKDFRAHPRVVSKIVHEASFNDDDRIQDMWAGLLVSSCTADGQDDGSYIYIELLSSLSKLQARLINFACENTKPELAPNGLLMPGRIHVSTKELSAVVGESDIHRLDREMDRLVSLDLMRSGFSEHFPADNLSLLPSVVGVGLYVRCQGFCGSPVEYYDLKPWTRPEG